MPEPMTAPECERLLAESVRDVLETMFFTCPADEPPEGSEPAPGPVVEIRFHGNPPGVFHQRLGEQAGRELAAAFLGEGDPAGIAEGDVANVLRELANVICGRALSRIESDSTFDLGAPEILGGERPEAGRCRAHCLVPLDAGPVEVWLALENPR